MDKIIEAGKPDGIQLPMLPYYQEYAYDPEAYELVVIEFPAKKEQRQKETTAPQGCEKDCEKGCPHFPSRLVLVVSSPAMKDGCHIVILDGHTANPGDLNWAEIEAIGSCVVHPRTGDADIVARARDADIILTNKTVLSREVIGSLPRLKCIGVLATGYNVVDVEAAKERGIPVCNVPEYSTPNVTRQCSPSCSN